MELGCWKSRKIFIIYYNFILSLILYYFFDRLKFVELIFTEMLCVKSDDPVDSANNENIVSETI
jgi:hypothetical protein